VNAPAKADLASLRVNDARLRGLLISSLRMSISAEGGD
jgi:hypothetical protein